MADFGAKEVQGLRQATGAGMMDAKKALVETEGDFDEAVKWLREKGLAKAATRTDRENSEGAVAVASTDGVAAIVELKCETDFGAKSNQFSTLVQELADLVAAKGESAVGEKAAEIDDLKITLKENIELGAVVRVEAGSGGVVETYIHSQDGRGVNAVVVELSGGSPELAHDVAVHAAFTRPRYLRREDVPESEVADERATLTTITKAEGKPDAALDKIVEGRLTGWFKDRVLLEQSFVKDEKTSVRELLGPVDVVHFAQVVVGG